MQKSDPFVDVTRVGLWLFVRPWLPWMEDVCTCLVRNSAVDYQYMSKEDKKVLASFKKPLFVLGNNGESASVLHGLWPLLEERLQKKGIPYSYRDNNIKPDLDRLDYNRIEGERLREGQDVMLSAVLSEWNGIVNAPPAMGKSFVIELLCKLYAGNIKVLVTSTRLTVVKELTDRIRKRCPDTYVRRCDGAHTFDEEADICVCSAFSLDKVPGDWPGIILFDEVHAAPASSIFLGLASFNCRMFGFSATPEGRGDGGNAITRAMFGKEIAKFTYQHAVTNGTVVPIEVRMVRLNGPAVTYHNPSLLNAFGIWRNVPRNLRIRDAARELQRLGHSKILIMVETVEHAYLLKKYLPEFKVVYSPIDPERKAELVKKCVMSEEDDPAPDVEGLKKEFREGKSPYVISTFIWKEAVDVPSLDALIRADGQPGEIPCVQICGRTSRLFEGKSLGIVVDFIDDFGPKLLGKSITRMKRYQKEGWSVYEWQLPKTPAGTVSLASGARTEVQPPKDS